jgi:hypothetical protein
MFNSFQTIEGKNEVSTHDDHRCRATAMTPQELLTHLKNVGDSTQTAISIYLAKLNTFSGGHARHNPSVNSKKKPDSEEDEIEEEEEEEEDEEEEVAIALDVNIGSHENVDMDACDNSKHGLESETATGTQDDPESEVTDGCDPFKKALGKNEFFPENFDMDEND